MNLPEVHKLSTVELTAARLRQQARELILMAEELEASVPKRKTKSRNVFIDPRTGKATPVKKGHIKW
ncbi:hypothetical protein [Desulforhopalus singaporensis]|uniref:Uncharacterized protein n=1 Tax=Desulforhopalus singaporensis TaxID=91360 RepID=A0A1H0RI78_9BACT|nr:hypothetical protein [Desulforhopalus singaporensis]SDP29135.1 hypothetical protein SAMN05660330_02306 [Desulforhopalus singaporensis]